jgi:uncharacterized protein YeaO (DUF488 family)
MIQIKRVYDPPAKTDGVRFLVERLWPRGVKKARLKLDDWLKDEHRPEEVVQPRCRSVGGISATLSGRA